MRQDAVTNGTYRAAATTATAPTPDPAAEAAEEAGKGLVPAWPSPPLDTPTSPSSLSMSRVVLTRGRALLDPALVVGGGAAAPVVHPAVSAVSPWMGGSAGAAGAKVSLGSLGGTLGAGSSNMLLMLLPASAVRWGKVWSESSEGTMEALLNNMKLDNSTGANGGGGGDGDREGIWVEIGCSVVRAQLVRNVTLAA